MVPPAEPAVQSSQEQGFGCSSPPCAFLAGTAPLLCPGETASGSGAQRVKCAACGCSGCSLPEPVGRLDGDTNQEDSSVICGEENELSINKTGHWRLG